MKRILLSTTLVSLLCPYTFAATEAFTPGSAPETAPGSHAVAPTPANATTVLPANTAINCTYHIPAETTTIDPKTIEAWVRSAVIQSFTYTPESLDQQLIELKACYTDQGFTGFNDAMQKSGNFSTIKAQKLNVSCEIDAKMTITPSKDNQWRVNVPLQVLYRNANEKIPQQLTVDLLVGRKMTGDLGIIQIIATPRQPEKSPSEPTAAQPAPSH